ncbi:MAG: hypothetical protein LJE95_06625 [Acidobacteria bacterium]|nr:hypothetical protein [Acidobacteriota bacterium]
MKVRLLPTLAWLQWRLIVNRLREGGKRDAMEKVSRVSELVVLVILGLLALPVVLLLAIGGAVAGWMLAAGGAVVKGTVVAASAVAAVPVMWVVLRPLFSVGEARSGSTTLLRLLPVPRAVFRNLELLRSLLDPVVLAFVPPLLLLPLGMLARGAVTGGLLALAASVLLLATVAALGSTVSLAIQLVARRRGRAELVTFALIVLLSVAGFLPQLFVHGSRPRPAARSTTAIERTISGPSALPLFIRYSPAGLYGTALARAAGREPTGVAVALGFLLLTAALLTVVSQALLNRLLTSSGSGGGGGSGGVEATATWRLPGFAVPTVAVAVAEARAHMRTVRGKIAVLTPALVLALMSIAFRHQAEGPMPVRMGNMLLIFLALFGSTGMATFSVNQFAVLRGGQLLEGVLPLAVRGLLTGKLLATTAMVIMATVAGAIVLVVLGPEVRAPFVVAAALAGIAAHVTLAPVAAVLSALFPKPVELSAIGRGAQPHGLAVLINLLGTLVALAPAVALGAGAYLLTHRAWLVPAAVLGELALAILFARLALPVASRLVASRGDNITLVASGH